MSIRRLRLCTLDQPAVAYHTVDRPGRQESQGVVGRIADRLVRSIERGVQEDRKSGEPLERGQERSERRRPAAGNNLDARRPIGMSDGGKEIRMPDPR